MTIITGRSLRLRTATLEDLPRLLAILADPGVAAWWGDDAADEVRELVAGGDPTTAAYVIERPRHPSSACPDTEQQVIGLVYLSEEDDPNYRHASIDVTLADSAQDQGLGTEAVRVAVRWLIEERGHHRVTIDPAVDNARAIACYRKVGFKPVGVLRRYERRRDGTWHDGLLMDLLAEEFSDNPEAFGGG